MVRISRSVLLLSLGVLAAGVALAQDHTTRFNEARLADRRSVSVPKNTRYAVNVWLGDVVLAQFVDGGGWKTTAFLYNFESTAQRLEVLFIANDGSDLLVDIASRGTVSSVVVTIPGEGTVSFETTATAATTKEGWAIVLPDSNTARVAAMAVFGSSAPGRPTFEAVVPASSMAETHFVLLYDNRRGYATAGALANTDFNPGTVVAIVKNDSGVEIARETIAFTAMQHQAFMVPERWTVTKEKSGSIEFISQGASTITGLGLRAYTPTGAFTSSHIIMEPTW